MDENTKIIRDYYDANVEGEWNRIADRPEFLLTCRMLDRFIKPGDKVLDIGGGPGRYSLYFARKGCAVTLLDLSAENINFAKIKAAEQKLEIQTVTGDARDADKLTGEQFDHILLMGPMYHLLDENDRIRAVNSAVNLLKSGGIIFVSFINMFAGIIYYMKYEPQSLMSPPPEQDTNDEYIDNVVEQKSFAGDAFTKAFFIESSAILPFMEQFPLEKLHLFGQEGVIAPCEKNIMEQPAEIVNQWLDFSERVYEREDLLNYSEHLMYVGRKK